jgi:hypothetical protein
MNLEDITVSEISQSQKEKYSLQVPRVVKFIESEAEWLTGTVGGKQ